MTPIIQLLNQHLGLLLTIGLILIAVFNLILWQRDKVLISKTKRLEPLPPLENWPSLPLVSVLVAAWNESEFIFSHIESFKKLAYPHKQLILCAGGDDSTFSLANKFANRSIVVVEQKPGEGKQKALQKCVKLSHGDIIYLTDADCLLNDGSFEKTIYPLVQGENIATGSRKPLPQQSNDHFVIYQWLCHEYGSLHHAKYVSGLEGRNAAIKRSVLSELGDFQDPVSIGTDYYLAIQAGKQGYSIRYIHDSRISTEHPQRIQEYIRQQSRWQRNLMLHSSLLNQIKIFTIFFSRSVYGLVIIFGALTVFVGSNLLVIIWALLLCFGYFNHLRYILIGKKSINKRYVKQPTFLQIAFFHFVEYVSWIVPWKDFICLSKRNKW